MRRYPADSLVQSWACLLLAALVFRSDVERRVRDAGAGELVVSALRAHFADSSVADACCTALSSMLGGELASSIDADAAESSVAAVLRTHPSDTDVHKTASRLAERILEYRTTPLVDGASPECFALARVAELKECCDFASLVRDMNAFPQCEELQCDGCDAIHAILQDGGSCEEAVAAGATECIIRTLDLFPHSAGTQGMVHRARGLRPWRGSHSWRPLCLALATQVPFASLSELCVLFLTMCF